VRSYGGEKALAELKASTQEDMRFYMELARQHGIASKYYVGFGVDGMAELLKLCRQVHEEFPRVVFFASKLVFDHETWVRRLLHNEIVYAMQRRLQAEDMQMVILPMKASLSMQMAKAHFFGSLALLKRILRCTWARDAASYVLVFGTPFRRTVSGRDD
jgi:hypothetical protein